MNTEYYKEERRLLRKAKEEGKLVIFVGAGASFPSGMPSWGEAIEKFKNCLYMGENERQDDYLKIPQLYYNARGEKEYVELARSIFRYEEALDPSDIHRRIVEFNVHSIITTNYDSLIEKAAAEQGEFLQVISRNQDLPYKTAQKEVIKIHGDFEHNNFVLKEDDYLNYSENFKLIETYIKSLIASNVILFVGYSFNDPDVKQLFNWVKSILGKDFQRAYMIEAYHEYNRNDFEYYKNLGVNVLYASKMKGESFRKEQASAYVVSMLDYILKDQQAGNVIDEIYDYLHPFNGINYVLQRYLKQAFEKHGIIIEEGRMWALNQTSQESEAAKIIQALTSKEKDEKVASIVEVLSKSCVKCIETIEMQESESDCEMISYPVEACKDSGLFNAVIYFDENALKRQKEKNELVLSTETPELYLKQAYICYRLEEYVNAYKYLKQASGMCYNRKLYQWYFIAELNRYFLGRMIQQPVTAASQEVKDKIKEEVSKIQLEKTFSKVPNIGNDGNQFLKELYTFQINHWIFRDIFKSAQIVREEADTRYFLYSKVPEYRKMRTDIKDYFLYLEENYLMIDQYSECMEIYRLYMETYLSSIGSGDKISKEMGTFGDYSANVHADRLGIFEIFLILRYWNVKELTNTMNRYAIELIDIEEECHEYLKIVFQNLARHQNQNPLLEDKLFVFLAFVTKIDLDSEFVEEIIYGISDRINEFIIRKYKAVILNFIIHQYNQKKILGQKEAFPEQSRPALEQFLGRIIANLAQKGKNSIRVYMEMISSITGIFKSIYGVCSRTVIAPILESEEYVRVLACMYPICDEEMKPQIKQLLINYMQNAGYEGFALYHDMVMNEIIAPDKQYEESIWNALPKMQKANKNRYPNEYIFLVNDMLNLYLNDKILLIDKCLEVCRQSEDAGISFLVDMEHFNYEEFELDWLINYSKKLRDAIAEHKIAGPKIRRQFKEYFMSGNDNDKLLKIYFESFA